MDKSQKDGIPTLRFPFLYSSPSIKVSKSNLYSRSLQLFSEKYGSVPEFIARAPGRVNLIGEHIDYSGYGVLPFALHNEIVFFVRKNTLGKIRFSNLNQKRFADSEFGLDPRIWKTERGAWDSYLLWGFRAILSLIESKGIDK